MNNVVVFDLDDTLYKEEDYLISAYKYIANYLSNKYSFNINYLDMLDDYRVGKNSFNNILSRFNIEETIDDLLELYRYHIPEISLDNETINTLMTLEKSFCIMGIITDGRTITQLNKIQSLGIDKYIKEHDLIISESFGSQKPSLLNYQYFMDKYPGSNYYYIGDNLKKDFIGPMKLGWKSICLKDIENRNIHKQIISLKDEENLIFINSIDEILSLII